MASNSSGDMGGFFQGVFGDLLKMMKTDTPLPWELTVQLALNVAGEAEQDGNVDPLERIHVEELARIAELHVADVTGVALDADGKTQGVLPVTRLEWARKKLELWRPLFESLAEALRPDPSSLDEQASPEEQDGDDENLASFFQTWVTTISPALTAMQLGSIVGHLAADTIGSYDFMLSGESASETLVCPENMSKFASDWSLPVDDANLYLIIRELAAATVLSRAHVRQRLNELILRRARAFRPDPHALESLIAEAGTNDLSDPTALMSALANPAALGELGDSDELRHTISELEAVVAAILGYIDWATDSVAKRCIGARQPIVEALRRRRLDSNEQERGAEALFGISPTAELIASGAAFISGVLERGREDDLARLVLHEGDLPTPAEISAPGLWIERIHLPAT